ncbi:MAG: lysophospholipase [Clostridium sp.]|jgi:alpha-beta hydrolase superfamily lysophospholipase|nr:lysophospholipase [Clostridium sp.]
MKKIKRKLLCAALIGGIALLLVYGIGGSLGALYFYNLNMARIELDKPFSPYLSYEDIDKEAYPREQFAFSSGENTLAGFEYGSGGTRGLVVVAAGKGGSGDDYIGFITHFVDGGYTVISYDKTGVARSEGETLLGLYQPVRDLDALLSYIEGQGKYGGLPMYLLGHSMGGYGVCAVLSRGHRVNAVVSMAGYNDGAALYTDQGLQMFGKKYYLLLPHFLAIQKITFGDDMAAAVDSINATDTPVLVIHGKNDEMVTCDTLSIYSQRDKITNPNVRYVLTEGDHEWLYSSKAAEEYRRQTETAFAEYCLKNGAEATDEAMALWAEEFGYDKVLRNEIDAELLAQIDALFAGN